MMTELSWTCLKTLVTASGPVNEDDVVSQQWTQVLGPADADQRVGVESDFTQSRCQVVDRLTHNTRARARARLTALCPGLPGWASTRKVKPIWILLEQETVSGSGISWAICKAAPRSRQITMPAPHHSVFYRSDALPAAQPTVSKHWRQICNLQFHIILRSAAVFNLLHGKLQMKLRNDDNENWTRNQSETAHKHSLESIVAKSL